MRKALAADEFETTSCIYLICTVQINVAMKPQPVCLRLKNFKGYTDYPSTLAHALSASPDTLQSNCPRPAPPTNNHHITAIYRCLQLQYTSRHPPAAMADEESTARISKRPRIDSESKPTESHSRAQPQDASGEGAQFLYSLSH